MILRDALRSLKRDFSRAIFYWLTFVLVTMFFFLLFNFAGAESAGIEFIDSNPLITGVVVLMLVVCSIDIFFANDFFIKTKAKDIGVRLVCGATYVHIASFLLIQTGILLVTAIPAGGLISMLIIPVFNSILTKVLHSTLHIQITASSVALTGGIVAYLVFWLVLLNLSFAYLNTAGTMMNERNLTRNRGNGSMFKLTAGGLFGKILNTVLFIAPLIGFWFVTPSTYLVLAFIGVYGFNGFVQSVVYPYCSKISSEKGLNNPHKMVLAGFFATDMMVNSLNVMLYIISVIILGTLIITASGQAVETVLITVAFVTACILQAMTIMFRSNSEFATRGKYYLTLDQLGFMEDDMQSIVRQETFLFFGVVLGTAVLYVGTVFLNLIRFRILSASIVAVLMVFMIVPMILFAIAGWMYHRSCIFPLTKER